MIDSTEGQFNGMPCRWLSNDQVRLAITTGRGPRILFWGWRDGSNLFAELPGVTLASAAGSLDLLGGHRLWHAPEVPDRTYWPDSEPVDVVDIEGGASFTAPPDGLGIVKQITVQVSPDQPEVTVTHTLTNAGHGGVQLAPWAISMCRTGGIALLPQPQDLADPAGVLPNRIFAVWPYSDVNDPRVLFGNRMVLIRAVPAPKNKIGYRSVHGWFAYWLEGTLFTRHFDPKLSGQHPDFGCNAEFYFEESFIELETLGPMVELAPGGLVRHQEVWRLHAVPSPPQSEVDAVALAAGLSL